MIFVLKEEKCNLIAVDFKSSRQKGMWRLVCVYICFASWL